MTFLTALILGLIASTHCTTMCSGLQMAFQPNQVIRSRQRIFWHNLTLNMGRLICYTVVGAIMAWGSVSMIKLINADAYVGYLRVATAIILLLIGIQMMLHRYDLLTPLQPVGQWLWQRTKKYYHRDDQDRLQHSFTNGLIWGMLPCGLLYSLYLTAALSGSSIQGAIIMFGFGLGTLPSLILSGGILMSLKRWLNGAKLQAAGGAFYCTGALLLFFAPSIADMNFAQSYPGLFNSVFCLN